MDASFLTTKKVLSEIDNWCWELPRVL